VRFVFCAATGEATAKPGLSSLCAEADFEPSAHESMHLPAGSVRFAGPHGSVLAVRDGDALFVPQAAPIAWESSGRVAKVYASRGKDQLPNGRSFSIG
jgi:hypothetical protein